MPIRWYKKSELYPEVRPRSAKGRMEPKRALGERLPISDDIVLKSTKPESYRNAQWSYAGDERADSFKDRVRTALQSYDCGIAVGDGAGGHQIDHIHELKLGGDDNERNLWPMTAERNRAANATFHQVIEIAVSRSKRGGGVAWTKLTGSLKSLRKEVPGGTIPVVVKALATAASSGQHGTDESSPVNDGKKLRGGG
ncbi:MAG: HNH endonuclease [Planctomycetes bacterium]|nr:HNH endonuclease [Planctomycetota bacterium]